VYGRLELEQIPRAHTIYDVAKLRDSDTLKNVMAKIDEFSTVGRKSNEIIGIYHLYN
jgi:hypothetical protein